MGTKRELGRPTAKAGWEGTERRWPLEAKGQPVGEQESPRPSEQDNQALRRPMLAKQLCTEAATQMPNASVYTPPDPEGA